MVDEGRKFTNVIITYTDIVSIVLQEKKLVKPNSAKNARRKKMLHEGFFHFSSTKDFDSENKIIFLLRQLTVIIYVFKWHKTNMECGMCAKKGFKN